MKLEYIDRLFQDIVENSSAPLLVFNCRTGVVVFANQAAADLHGYSRVEMTDMDGFLLTAQPEDSKYAWDHKRPYTPLRKHRKKDGSFFSAEIFRGFFDLEGESYAAVTVFDIESRLKTAAELTEQHLRWEIACEASNSGIWDRNFRTQYGYRSSRWYQILGYEPADLPNSTWLGAANLIHPDDLENVLEKRRLHLEGKLPIYDVEHRVLRKDGSYLWCGVRGKALFDENGIAYRMIGFLTDIQALVEAREKLKNQNHALKMLHEIALSVIQSPDVDRNKTISLIAKHASTLFNASYFFLSTLDDPGDSMIIRSCIGNLNLQTASFVRGQYLSGKAWETGEIQIKQDYRNWADRLPDLDAANISTLMAVPMKAGDLVVGVFSLGFNTPREFSEEELNILQQFAAIGALLARTTEADRKLDRMVNLSRRTAFLNMLVSGDSITRDEITRRALNAGISLKGPYVAISIEREQEPIKPPDSTSTQTPWFHVLDPIQDELAAALVWERYAALNVLYPIDKDCTDIKQFTLDAARRIRTTLQAYLPEVRFSIGIGNLYKDMTEVHRSFKEAREALDTGRRLGGDGLYHYLDIGIVQMLARMGQQGPIRAFVNNTIGRLLDYDQRRKGQFLPTLEMILTGKSLRIISEEMNVHQKTIVFRKMRIEEILNLPLDEGDVRLNLSIALKLHKLTQSIEAEKQFDPVDKKKRKTRRRRNEQLFGNETGNAELNEI